jgi:uncharacterized RDD family membrane protein YckC
MTEADPYRSPETAHSALEIPADYSQLANAGKGRRFLTFVVDYLGQTLLTMLAVIPFVIVAPSLGDSIEAMSKVQEMLFGIAAMLLYYIAFEGLWGRTPGKWICGTRVIDERGGKPRFGQVLGRTFARLIPFEPFSLLVSARDDLRGWHDELPKTRVVTTR